MPFLPVKNAVQIDEPALSIPPGSTTRIILNLAAGRLALKEKAQALSIFVDRELSVRG